MVRPGRLATIVVLWALAEDDELAPDETRPLELIDERSSKPGRTRSTSYWLWPCDSHFLPMYESAHELSASLLASLL